MKCLHCGTELSDQDSFCNECGTKVSKDVCKCGAVKPSTDALYCTNCGKLFISFTEKEIEALENYLLKSGQSHKQLEKKLAETEKKYKKLQKEFRDLQKNSKGLEKDCKITNEKIDAIRKLVIESRKSSVLYAFSIAPKIFRILGEAPFDYTMTNQKNE